MKKGKKLILLLIALILIVACLIIVKKLTPKEADATDFTVLSVEPEKFSYSRTGDIIELVKENDKYYLTSDKSLEVDQDKAAGMAAALREIKAVRKIEAVEELSEYGLDNPSIQIAVNDSIVVSIGNSTAVSRNYYMSVNDGNVYIIESALRDAFISDLDDLIVNTSENEAEEE